MIRVLMMERDEKRDVVPRPSWIAALILLLSAATVVASEVAPGAIHRIEGVVISGGSGISEVEVRSNGVALATTDDRGWFSLSLPRRDVRLTFVREGFYERRVIVRPSPDSLTRVEVEIEPLGRIHESITVTARRELNTIQKETSVVSIGSEELGVSPALSAAEAIDRVAGVSILRDAGEADEVFIRGMEPRLTSTMIDGERIPGTDGDDRTAALFLFPLELLEVIEVQTTFTPEMDADVIGGSVNLLTRRAPQGGIARLHFGMGYEEQSGGEKADAGLVLGGRYLNERLGLILSVDMDGGDQGVDQLDRSWEDEESLERIELRDVDVDRQRVGGLARLDYAPSVRSDLSAKVFATEFGEDELRRRVVFDGESSSVFREFREAVSDKSVTSVDFSGAHVFGTPVQIGYRLGFFRSKEDAPEQIDTSFVLEDVEFRDTGVLEPIEEDLDGFVLDEISVEDHEAIDENLIAGLDLAMPFRFRERSAEFRSGLKIRAKEKRQTTRRTVFESDEDEVFLSDFVDASVAGEVIGGFRSLGVVPSRNAAAEMIRRFGLEGERDLSEEAANYDATEDSVAGYALMETDVASDATLLVGLRYERTESRYDGFLLTTVGQDDEEEAILEPVSGENSYDFLMPAALVAMKIGPASSLKVAISRTFARPDYIHLVPSSQIDQDDREIERGNPDLRVTRSWNFDLLWDWSPSTGAEISIAPYYKQIDDFVFESRSAITFEEDEFHLIEPRNGDDARVYGVDLGLHHDLFSVAGNALFYDLNVSWSESRARIPERPFESIPFPGHAELSGGLLVGHSSPRFDIRLEGSYVDDLLLEVGESSAEDLYAAHHFRFDLLIATPLSRTWSLYLRGANLTDERVDLYEGSGRTPTLTEQVGRSVTVGARWGH